MPEQVCLPTYVPGPVGRLDRNSQSKWLLKGDPYHEIAICYQVRHVGESDIAGPERAGRVCSRQSVLGQEPLRREEKTVRREKDKSVFGQEPLRRKVTNVN